MTRVGSRIVSLFALVLGAVACTAPAETEEVDVAADSQALEEARASSAASGRPTVFAVEMIEPDMNAGYDWSRDLVEVPDDGVSGSGWRAADKVASPDVTRGIRDQIQGGLGGGPCRLKVQPLQKTIGIRCKWTF